MAEPSYHRGAQNIAEQVKTYEVFGAMTKWGSLGIAGLLVLLVLWFCTSAGFFTALVSAVVILAVGIFFLRDKPAGDH